MNVYQIVAEFRINLLRRDAGAQRELQVAYDQAFEAIKDELANTARQLEASGSGASPALLARDRRLRDLQEQVSAAMAELGDKAGNIATREQRVAVTSARDEAVQLIEAKAARAGISSAARARVTGVFNRLPSDVIAELVGVSAKGTPVRIVFEEIARDLGFSTSERITRALVQGVTLGQTADFPRGVNRREGNGELPEAVLLWLEADLRACGRDDLGQPAPGAFPSRLDGGQRPGVAFEKRHVRAVAAHREVDGERAAPRQRGQRLTDERRLAVAARRDEEDLLAGGQVTAQALALAFAVGERSSRDDLAVDKRVSRWRRHYPIIRNGYGE